MELDSLSTSFPGSALLGGNGNPINPTHAHAACQVERSVGVCVASMLHLWSICEGNFFVFWANLSEILVLVVFYSIISEYLCDFTVFHGYPVCSAWKFLVRKQPREREGLDWMYICNWYLCHCIPWFNNREITTTAFLSQSILFCSRPLFSTSLSLQSDDRTRALNL